MDGSSGPVDGSVGPSPVGAADGGPGLAARMSSVGDALAGLLADLDPGLLVGPDAVALYRDFCRLERLVCGGKTLLAPRIAESGCWEADGHRSAAGLLAALEGGTAGPARRTLEAGRALVDLPATEAALRSGTLSGPKLAEVTGAAGCDPDAEGSLLAGIDRAPLGVVKERCRSVRTQAASADPVATLARIHAQRSFTSWTDDEGAFCFSGRDSAERGARLVARLDPVAERLRRDRREAGTAPGGHRPAGAPVPPPESEAALRADALFALVTGHPAGRTGGRIPTDTDGAPTDADGTTGSGPDGDPEAEAADLGGVEDLVAAGPPATVIVRVDLAALRRGRARPGELCELDGHGTVPVEVVRGLVDDAFLACVFTEAGDIRAVAHLGRTINRHLRTALAFRDRYCVVPGCQVAYSLEIDHVVPLESGGDTRLDNLALLCRHHHRLKTYEGWILERNGPTDEDPGWPFTPAAALRPGARPGARPGRRPGRDPSDPRPVPRK